MVQRITRVARCGSIWIPITDMAAQWIEMNLSSCSAASLDGISPRQRRAVSAKENRAHLAIAHTAAQVDHLVHAKSEQLISGHMAQCVSHRLQHQLEACPRQSPLSWRVQRISPRRWDLTSN